MQTHKYPSRMAEIFSPLQHISPAYSAGTGSIFRLAHLPKQHCIIGFHNHIPIDHFVLPVDDMV